GSRIGRLAQPCASLGSIRVAGAATATAAGAAARHQLVLERVDRVEVRLELRFFVRAETALQIFDLARDEAQDALASFERRVRRGRRATTGGGRATATRADATERGAERGGRRCDRRDGLVGAIGQRDAARGICAEHERRERTIDAALLE